MTDPIDKYDEHRAAALAKVERRIEREIAAIEAAGLDPGLATIAEVIAAGVVIDDCRLKKRTEDA